MSCQLAEYECQRKLRKQWPLPPPSRLRVRKCGKRCCKPSQLPQIPPVHPTTTDPTKAPHRASQQLRAKEKEKDEAKAREQESKEEKERRSQEKAKARVKALVEESLKEKEKDQAKAPQKEKAKGKASSSKAGALEERVLAKESMWETNAARGGASDPSCWDPSPWPSKQTPQPHKPQQPQAEEATVAQHGMEAPTTYQAQACAFADAHLW